MKTIDHKTELLEKLTEAGIRPSMQRLEILEFISSCKSHPTAGEIPNELGDSWFSPK